MGTLNTSTFEIPWDGSYIDGEVMAFDTETTIVDCSKEVPDLVCLSASNGVRTVVVFPDQLELFFSGTMFKQRMAAWNIGFDWWAVRKAADRLGIKWFAKRQLLLTDDNYYGDTMLLEQLVTLAEGRDGAFFSKSLKKASKEYLGIEVEKDEDIRQGFTLDMVEGDNWKKYMKSWEYAAQDAKVTYDLDQIMTRKARDAARTLPWCREASGPYGLLTEAIQVKASLALSQITRNGIGVDREKVARLATESKKDADEALARLASTLGPGLIKKWKKAPRTDEVKETSSGLPQLNKVLIQKELNRLADLNGLDPPRTEKSKRPTDSADWWTINCPHEPFVKDWATYTTKAKTYQMTAPLVGDWDRIHPEYRPLVRTGRTSAHRPNIQNQDRDHRDMFVAAPGHVLGAFDYSAIELVTLAAVCYDRLGRSTLGDVLKRGVDPHTNTACLVRGISLDQFNHLEASDKKHSRQSAKALNFGIPGGLGARKGVAYAKANYGIDISQDEFAALRRKIITEVYPEWSEWLQDGLATRLSYSTGCSLVAAENVLGEDRPFFDPIDHPSARVLAGLTTKKEGGKFAPWYVENVWQNIEHCVSQGDGRLPEWVDDAIWNRSASPALAAALINVPAVTLTGRSRLKTYYGEWRNTQFQGLASDGAKMALWELTREGFRIVAFVHDEVVIEFKESEAEDGARRVVEIMSNAFRPVLGPKGRDIPIIVKHELGSCWSKP